MTKTVDLTIEEGNKLIAELSVRGYKVSSDGQVIGKTGINLKLQKSSCGYLIVNTYHKGTVKTFLVHRLVASAFIQNADNLPEVNHIDGNKLNNHFTNLEWVSRSDNILHGIKTGLIQKSMHGRTGAKHWRSIPVIAYAVSGESMVFESTGDAARKLGFNRKSIYDAIHGKLKTYKQFKWKYKS